MILYVRECRLHWIVLLLPVALRLSVEVTSAQEPKTIGPHETLKSLHAELWGPHNVDERGMPLRVRVHDANGERINRLVDAFPALNMLYIHPTEDLKAEDLHYLERLRDLKALWYSGFLADVHATAISRLTGLKELSVSIRGPAEGRDLTGLRRLVHLETLRLGVGFDIYAATEDRLGAAVIELFPELKTLDLSHASVSDKSIEAASNITTLRRLTLSGGTNVGPNGYRPLKRLTNLEVIQFYMPRADEAVSQLRSTNSLQEVEGFPDLTDAGMLILANVTSLKRLHNICSDKISDASWSHLERLTELESLELHSPRVSGSGISNMNPLKKLKRLNLRHTDFDATNIAFLLRFNTLEELDLGCTSVGDQDWKSLVVLKDLPHLRELSVELSEPTRLKLQEAMPNVTITFFE